MKNIKEKAKKYKESLIKWLYENHNDAYQVYCKYNKLWYFAFIGKKADIKTKTSPSGKYSLILTQIKSPNNGHWNYCLGEVIRLSDNKKIATIRRNYSAFPHAWIEPHANGHSYLICGEDYQGQTVIELDTGKRVDYLPTSASVGIGFCWASIYPNPDGTILAVDGCYWACPYELVFYDFSDPMNPPWFIYSRLEETDKVTWLDKDKCECLVNYEHCLIYDKPENELTDEELDEVDKLEASGTPVKDIFEFRTKQSKIWEHPKDNVELAIKYIDKYISWYDDKELNKYSEKSLIDNIAIINKLIEKMKFYEFLKFKETPQYKALVEAKFKLSLRAK